MIAIDIDTLGEGLASWLRGELALGEGDVFALSREDTDCRGADVLVISHVDRDRLLRILSPEVRWIHALSTGVDRFPFDLLGDRILTCSRGASAIAISEFVLASILAFVKQIPTTWISSSEEWKDTQLGQLSGQTLGLIGMGAIGTETAKRAMAFDMKVIAFRKTKAAAPISGISIAPELNDVLGASDHLVIAAPSTPETFHIIDAKAFEAMKPGVHLINIARGKLIDQNALIDALDSDRIAMASLDVTDPEPPPAGDPLYTHPKVRLTAHISWSSPTSMRRSVELLLDNLRLHLAGQPLQGVVDVAAGY